MTLPDHYRRFFRTHLRFALASVVVGLLTGILFQESGKKLPISATVPVGAHLEYLLSLALVHGHTFLVGVLVPLALTWMLQLGMTLGHPPVSGRALRTATRLYLPGASAVLALMLLKGYHFVLGARHGQLDYGLLSQSFLGQQPAVRAAIYGLSHTVMAAGLLVVVISLWRSMNRAAQA